jgi:hypothetical protein
MKHVDHISIESATGCDPQAKLFDTTTIITEQLNHIEFGLCTETHRRLIGAVSADNRFSPIM